MKSIQTAVLANQADLGIIFDTDVDRFQWWTNQVSTKPK